MRKIIRLYKFEQKTAFKCMLKACLLFLGIITVSLLLITIYIKALQEDRVRAITNIAVVNEDKESDTSKLIPFAGKLNGLKQICSIKEYEEEEAFWALSENKVQMVVVIPDGFMNKSIHMQEVAFQVFTSGDLTETDKKIISLFHAVEKVMSTTEGSILSMYEGMDSYSIDMTTTEMENSLTSLYVNNFLGRDRYFDIRNLSPYGSYSIYMFYLSACIVLSMSFSGAFFLKMYNQEVLTIESIFAGIRAKSFGMMLLKIFSVGLAIALPYEVFLFILNLICDAFGYDFLYMQAKGYAMILLVAISIGAFVHVFGGISRDSDRLSIYVLACVLMTLLSGLAGGRYYLPSVLRPLADIWPAGVWNNCILAAFWGEGAEVNAALFVLLVILLPVGMWLYHRRMRLKRC